VSGEKRVPGHVEAQWARPGQKGRKALVNFEEREAGTAVILALASLKGGQAANDSPKVP
jgi:hypothetical protein